MKMIVTRWLPGLALAAAGFIVVAALLSSCTRPPAPLKETKVQNAEPEEDPLQLALDTLRGTRTAAAFRQALRPIDAYLQRAEERAKVQLAPADRELLEKYFRLDKEEMTQVEASYFQSLDAYHLEECFLLHDALRAIEQPGVSRLRQAELCLEWTARQVLLRERADQLIPPLFVLKRGDGTARERALILLGLLKQMQVPACVLAWPPPAPGGPRTVLVGVLDGAEPQLYLFDPRLGRAVPGPGGKGVATLKQLRQQPALFPVSKEDEGKRPELLLACSLADLAPRMFYLDKRLEGTERVVLGIEADKLLTQIRKAAGEDVGVWNPPADRDPAACDSPVRMLRHFMPTAEGGLDNTDRMRKLALESIRWPKARRRLQALRLLGDSQFLAIPAQEQLHSIALRLFTPYAVETRDFLLRGQYERATRRLDMILSALDDLEFAAMSEREFDSELRDWCRRAHEVYLAQVKRLPQAKDMENHFWAQDQYLWALLEAQERPNPQKQPKTILTVILLTVLKDSLGQQSHSLQAQAWQERAERNAVSWKNPDKSSNARAARSEQSVREAWDNAAALWRKSVEHYSVDWANFAANLKHMQFIIRTGDFEQLMVVWTELFEDMHRTAASRLNLARALEQSGKKAEAVRQLTELEQNLAAFRSNPLLQERLQEFTLRTESARHRWGVTFLASLRRELGPQGGLQTIADIVQQRLSMSKGK